MALEQWAPRALDQSNAAPAQTIQLSVNEGTICETWTLPFPTVEVFLESARAIQASLAAESPKGKRVPLMFTALAKDGSILSSQASSCMGTNAAADSMIGAGNNAAKAFAESMVLQVASMNALLTASKTWVEMTSKAMESLTEQLVDHREYVKALHEAEIARLAKLAESAPPTTELPEVIREQLSQMLPLAQEAAAWWLQGVMEKKNVKPLAAVAAQTTQVVNGAPKA